MSYNDGRNEGKDFEDLKSILEENRENGLVQQVYSVYLDYLVPICAPII